MGKCSPFLLIKGVFGNCRFRLQRHGTTAIIDQRFLIKWGSKQSQQWWRRRKYRSAYPEGPSDFMLLYEPYNAQVMATVVFQPHQALKRAAEFFVFTTTFASHGSSRADSFTLKYVYAKNLKLWRIQMLWEMSEYVWRICGKTRYKENRGSKCSIIIKQSRKSFLTLKMTCFMVSVICFMICFMLPASDIKVDLLELWDSSSSKVEYFVWTLLPTYTFLASDIISGLRVYT